MSAIGEFRERVVIQRESRVADTGGGATLSWVDVAEVWASVTPLTGKEVLAAEGLSGEQLYRFRFRYPTSLTTAMRLAWSGKALNIRSLRVIEARGRVLDVIAEEGVAV